MFISQIIEALQAQLEEHGDLQVMQAVFAKPGDLEPMTELPLVVRRDEEGEFVGLVMRLP